MNEGLLKAVPAVAEIIEKMTKEEQPKTLIEDQLLEKLSKWGINDDNLRYFSRAYFEPQMGCGLLQYIQDCQFEHALAEYRLDPTIKLKPRDTYKNVPMFLQKYNARIQEELNSAPKRKKYMAVFQYFFEEQIENDFMFADSEKVITVDAISRKEAIEKYLRTHIKYHMRKSELRNKAFEHYLDAVQYGDIYDIQTFSNNKHFMDVGVQIYETFFEESKTDIDTEILARSAQITDYKEKFMSVLTDEQAEEIYIRYSKDYVACFETIGLDEYEKHEEKNLGELIEDLEPEDIFFLDVLSKMIRENKGKETYKITKEILVQKYKFEETKASNTMQHLYDFRLKNVATADYENGWANYVLTHPFFIDEDEGYVMVEPTKSMRALACGGFEFGKDKAKKAREIFRNRKE